MKTRSLGRVTQRSQWLQMPHVEDWALRGRKGQTLQRLFGFGDRQLPEFKPRKTPKSSSLGAPLDSTPCHATTPRLSLANPAGFFMYKHQLVGLLSFSFSLSLFFFFVPGIKLTPLSLSGRHLCHELHPGLPLLFLFFSPHHSSYTEHILHLVISLKIILHQDIKTFISELCSVLCWACVTLATLLSHPSAIYSSSHACPPPSLCGLCTTRVLRAVPSQCLGPVAALQRLLQTSQLVTW